MTVTTKPIVTIFYSVEDRPRITSKGAMLRYLGDNTGNLLFRYALQERIVDLSNCELLRLPSTLDLFRSLDFKTCRQILTSALVIYPVANLLRSPEDFEANSAVQSETEYVTYLLQMFPGPFLVMGLGYQGRLRSQGAASRPIHPLQVEMLEALLQRTPEITLRGDTTQAVLREQKNLNHARLEALGCPSLLISPDVDHGKRMADQLLPEPISKIGLGLPSNPHGYAPLFERLIQLAQDPRVHVVLQDASDIQACSDAGLPDERVHMFCDLSEWIAFLKGCDVCITARLHGAQVAVLAMTQVLLIATDSRMEELAQRMALNWIAMDDPDLMEILDNWPALMHRAYGFDGARYDANRRHLARKTVRFLQNLGLPAHRDLRTLAGDEDCSEIWAPPTSKGSSGIQFAELDVADYLARNPDPFLRSQNLLGLAYHACKTGNSWRSRFQGASSLDLAARITEDLVVLTGWSTDRSTSAHLIGRWGDGLAQIVPLGQIRIRRPDVAKAIGNTLPEPDFGFFLIVTGVPLGADMLEIEMLGNVVRVPIQDWRRRPHGEVTDALLDACQWLHTPASVLPGLIQQDLGLGFRAVLSQVQRSNANHDWGDLDTELKLFRASTLCVVCLDDVLSARVQLQRLGTYASVQEGDLAVVVMLQPEIVCRFSNSPLVEVVDYLVRDWPEVQVIQRRLDGSWQQSIQAVLSLCGTQFTSCAVLLREVLTSASDWINALQSDPVFTQPVFERFVPSLYDFSGQPFDCDAAYLQKLPFLPNIKTTIAVATEPLLVERHPMEAGVMLASLPPQSREAWRARVEAGIW